MGKRKVCVFTGTRAEYGLLKPLMENIKKEPTLKLQIVVSGMHLSPEFGLTYREVIKDGFKIDDKVEMLLSSDTPVGVCKSIGLGVISYSEVLERLKPDVVVVLGDRFETFAFAIASYVLRIPVAHLYGGELTYGAIDEAFRHSITKMSYLHFTSTEKYRNIVIQLGESPDRVFNVGSLGIDNIKRLPLLSKSELEDKLGFKFGKRNFLVTFHPATAQKGKTEEYFGNLLSVLEDENFEDIRLIFTKANADAEGRIINQMIDSFVSRNSRRAVAFASMGQLLYLSTMRYVDAVVGNSSSGIIEAPSFKIGTINIGNRQEGRIKADSVIDCDPTRESIRKAIEILYSSGFQSRLRKVKNPYGDGHAAERITNILKNVEIGSSIKSFYTVVDPLNEIERGSA